LGNERELPPPAFHGLVQKTAAATSRLSFLRDAREKGYFPPVSSSFPLEPLRLSSGFPWARAKTNAATSHGGDCFPRASREKLLTLPGARYLASRKKLLTIPGARCPRAAREKLLIPGGPSGFPWARAKNAATCFPRTVVTAFLGLRAKNC